MNIPFSACFLHTEICFGDTVKHWRRHKYTNNKCSYLQIYDFFSMVCCFRG